MKDCKRCEMWKLILIMGAIVLGVVVLAFNVEATHDEASKRLDIPPVTEHHLKKAANGRLMRAEAMRFCPMQIVSPDCVWLVTFFAHNPDDMDEAIAYAIFSTDMKTSALGCLLKYTTADEKILIDRSFSETACAKEKDSGT